MIRSHALHQLRRLLLCLCSAVAPLVQSSAAFAQAAWEYTPYQVRLLIALEPAPQLPGDLSQSLGEFAAARAESALGAIWRMEPSSIEPKLRDALLYQMKVLTAEQVIAAVPADALTADKLYLAAITCDEYSYQVAVREFDCRAQQLGPLHQGEAQALVALPCALWDAMAISFTPLARIESVEENRIVARIRAGGLTVDSASPAIIEPGSVMRPIMRRTGRDGRTMQTDIQAPPWTVLLVGERRDSLLECTVYSGYRSPIPARASARVERLALLVQPREGSTRLVLTARDNPNKPLPGYEIHARAPKEEQPHLLGRTDSTGAFELPAGGGLEIVYVKNGQQLLARLPILPGQQETLVARVPDDDRRLEAEGFVAALSTRTLDLVARREILAARFRARLKEQAFSEAQELLEGFRGLETRADLIRDLNQYRQRTTTSDKITQDRIDKLFADAQQMLLLKPLSDELLAQLTRELTAARAANSATESKTAG